LFLIIGLSMRDIAKMGGKLESTIKAQTNAIYRKAGVTGRTQLLSTFIEGLLSTFIEGLMDEALLQRTISRPRL